MPAPYQRRTFLRLAVLAPAAVAGVAGCATAASGKRDDHAPAKAAAKPPAADEGPSAAETLRAVPLAMDVEPAFVFRAGRGESR